MWWCRYEKGKHEVEGFVGNTGDRWDVPACWNKVGKRPFWEFKVKSSLPTPGLVGREEQMENKETD